MTELPPINVVIITFLRRDMFRRTVDNLIDKLHYSGPISWIIADDSTPEPDYQNFCLSVFRKTWSNGLPDHHEIRVEGTPQNSGWGANANNAISKCEHDIVFFIEDDYVLTRPLDLSPFVALLLENDAVGLVRMDGIAGHRGINCQTAETNIRDYLPGHRDGVGGLGDVHYWLIDQRSSHLNVYSNRPHLKHRRFHEFYGPYPEGYRLGQTESMFAHTVKDKMRANPNAAPALAIPLNANSYFDHIGVSFQLSEWDKGRK